MPFLRKYEVGREGERHLQTLAGKGSLERPEILLWGFRSQSGGAGAVTPTHLQVPQQAAVKVKEASVGDTIYFFESFPDFSTRGLCFHMTVLGVGSDVP